MRAFECGAGSAEASRRLLLGVLAAAALCGCGGREEGPESQAPVSAAEARRLVRFTRFAPGAGPDTVPAALAGLCQMAETETGNDEPLRLDTLSFDRAPRAMVRHDVESHFNLPLRCVVRTQREWDMIRPLTSIHDDATFTTRAPDFRTEMVVVAAMGYRPTIFYDIGIDGSWLSRDTLVVAVRTSYPMGETVGDMGTNPAMASRVPRARVVFFLER